MVGLTPMPTNPWMQNGVATPAYSGSMSPSQGPVPWSQPLPDPTTSAGTEPPALPAASPAPAMPMPLGAPPMASATDPRWAPLLQGQFGTAPAGQVSWSQIYNTLYPGAGGGNGLANPAMSTSPAPPQGPGMNGLVGSPPTNGLGSHLNEPGFGPSMGGQPRNDRPPSADMGGRPGTPRAPMGSPPMAGPTPSEPGMRPGMGGGNAVPMFPGSQFKFIGGHQLPVRRTLMNLRTNSQEIPLLESLFSASGRDPAAEFGKFHEYLPRGGKASLTAF